MTNTADYMQISIAYKRTLLMCLDFEISTTTTRISKAHTEDNSERVLNNEEWRNDLRAAREAVLEAVAKCQSNDPPIDPPAQEDPARIEMLTDILVAAVEGGTGYWAQVSDYNYSNDDPTRRGATLHELDDDAPTGYSPKGIRLTLETIENAMVAIAASQSVEDIGMPRHAWPGASIRKLVAGALATNDAGDADAEIADCITQVALLGKVIYG